MTPPSPPTNLDGHYESLAHRPLLVKLGIVDRASVRSLDDACSKEGIALDELVHA